ncbi:family 43 glycosylhydrolase [Microbulbifer thermotolerans]|uniref:family 43 glycosylhydrolase n=1 Tax=Microbulbifer thermotolerans TaxID=252514 RepID=UPI00224A8E0A|nr:family 43 glycosylhydrolase [Microbulbifer thermotolerans]MCX2783691.1 family 43 glycosylhydrolase [Microbulbifer thermotolerans]
MVDDSRRNLFKTLIAGAASAPFLGGRARADQCGERPQSSGTQQPMWARGIEGQRKADFGNGYFLNPILPGDRPDPTILKDGRDYYMTFTSFKSYPGLVIWHSTDLVNWIPIGPALFKPIGNVFAVDLCKYGDRYYIYIPAVADGRGWSIYVIWADDIRGPWSEPIDLKIPGCIDPGHVVGEDGRRYLFVNGIRKVRLSDDGLSADGELETAYDPWRYPDHWVVENFAPEGPKLLRRGGWFYLITAVGGTAGPPTGHMVIAARSKSIHGHWEHCPHNPLVRTTSADELWWSRGHATLVEGPAGDWWMVYHGYENGFRTLGRQVLLEPIEWTDDGWLRAKGGDLSIPLRMPVGGGKRPGSAGFALSDDFSENRFGLQWCFHNPAADELQRIRYEKKGLRFAARGRSPADSAPLICVVGDRAYEAEVTVDLLGEEEDTEGGLLLFYNHKAFVGLGFSRDHLKTFQYAEEQRWLRQPSKTSSLRIRLTNDNHIVTYHYSRDEGRTWILHGHRMEVSGIHHNVFGGFLSLRIGLYSSGNGSIRLRNFTYRAL